MSGNCFTIQLSNFPGEHSFLARNFSSLQEDPPNDADDLGLDNVGGVFVVLLGGCIFAVFLAFGELFYDIYYREDKVPNALIKTE